MAYTLEQFDEDYLMDRGPELLEKSIEDRLLAKVGLLSTILN
ncbi:MAG: hypothetical protein AAF639_16385 [Chloroflexota bacterium]